MSVADLLAPFPRVNLTHAPTPFEFMPNLTRHLGGPDIWVKRDDCTGLAMGGNKSRQLEFYFGDAKAQGCDTVLITGAVQSNFLRMTAAAASKLGMACEIQHEDRVKGQDTLYHQSGNVLLDKMFGAVIHTFPEGEDEAGADAALEQRADALRKEGRMPYVIHLGANHPPLGALGYIDAAEEVLAQAKAEGVELDAIVVPSGSAATHSGTLAGLRLHGSTLPVLGVCVRRGVDAQGPRVKARTQDIHDMLGSGQTVPDDDVILTDAVLAPGYGLFGDEVKEALTLAARMEGLLADPVYSGKTLAGLIDKIRSGELTKGQSVCFMHTGGTPALFGYSDGLVQD